MIGKIKSVEFKGPKTGLINRFLLYIPPNFNESEEYNIIYHLHPGLKEGLEIYIHKHMDFVAEIFEKSKKEALIVMPIADYPLSLWCDSYDNKIMDESKIIKDLIPYINSQYNIGETFLQGFSMGGYGSVMLMAKYPELFRKVINFDGGFFSFKSLGNRLPESQKLIFNNDEAIFNKNDPYHLLANNKNKLNSNKLLTLVGKLETQNIELNNIMNENNLNNTYIKTEFQHEFKKIFTKYHRQCFNFYGI